jgi:hypothetical protein
MSENTNKCPITRIWPYTGPRGALYHFFQNRILVVFSYYDYVKLAPKLFTLTQIKLIVNPESPTLMQYHLCNNFLISFQGFYPGIINYSEKFTENSLIVHLCKIIILRFILL